jgi:hypothetical protein
MSDFSELCPLFETGVFSEITFPAVDMNDITLSGNALYGSLFPSTTMDGVFTFGRTVVVTGGFARRYTDLQSVTVNLRLVHFTSQAAAGTVFGSCTMLMTLSLQDYYAWTPFTVTDKTFTSDEILGISPSLGAAGSMGSYDFIIRYKEK